MRAAPARPGQAQRIEHESVCNGVAQIFLEVEPLCRRRHVEVGKRRTRNDWARFIRGMPEERYAEADCVVLVLENLNMHGIESLYETYPPALALALTERLEIHYTPRHGSWLNISEIERSALCGQCVNRRIPDRDTMRREIEAWERDRNNRHAKVDWQFRTSDVRVTLRILYPIL